MTPCRLLSRKSRSRPPIVSATPEPNASPCYYSRSQAAGGQAHRRAKFPAAACFVLFQTTTIGRLGSCGAGYAFHFYSSGDIKMKRIMALSVVFVFVGLIGATIAADATGTWKWTATRGGQSIEATAKLKQEGEKLTGVYVGGQSNTES